MANNFYNINIHKYDPTTKRNVGQDAAVQANENSNPNSLNEQVKLFMQQDKPKDERSSHERLNALDSTILVNEAYQNLDDETFKSEYQINKLEESLKSIDKEIEQARAINDLQKVDVLVMRKHSIQEKLKGLYKTYGQSDVTAKLSGGIASILNKKPTIFANIVDNCVNFMSEKILPKISKQYDSGRNIKLALGKLETLNKNVDELVTMQAPFGEADERYDMLTEYLNRANVIHYNISKTVGTPTFFDTISSVDKEKLYNGKNKSNFGKMTGNMVEKSLMDNNAEI